MNFEMWMLKKLLGKFISRAMKFNDFIIADNVIVIHDAINEINKRIKLINKW